MRQSRRSRRRAASQTARSPRRSCAARPSSTAATAAQTAPGSTSRRRAPCSRLAAWPTRAALRWPRRAPGFPTPRSAESNRGPFSTRRRPSVIITLPGSFNSTHGLLSLFPRFLTPFCCMAGCSSSLASTDGIRLPICSYRLAAVSRWGLVAARSLLRGRWAHGGPMRRGLCCSAAACPRCSGAAQEWGCPVFKNCLNQRLPALLRSGGNCSQSPNH